MESIRSYDIMNIRVWNQTDSARKIPEMAKVEVAASFEIGGKKKRKVDKTKAVNTSCWCYCCCARARVGHWHEKEGNYGAQPLTKCEQKEAKKLLRVFRLDSWALCCESWAPTEADRPCGRVWRPGREWWKGSNEA